MKNRLIFAFIGAVIAAWATPGFAQRQATALDATVNGAGVTNGVDTTSSGTLTVLPGQSINTTNDPGGAVIQAPATFATVTFGGSSTVTGLVSGTAGAPIFNINAGATATTVNFNGAVNATTFHVTGTGTINFNANTIGAGIFDANGFVNLGAGRTLTGAITTTAGDGTGTLTLNAGSSLTGAVGALAAGIKVINVVGGNASLTGAVFTSGLNFGTNTLAVTGALTTGAGATIATTLASNVLFGNATVANNNTLGGGITVTPIVSGVLTNGTIFTIVKGTATATAGATVFVVNTNPLFTFTGLPTNAFGDVRIVAALNSGIITTPAAASAAPILNIPAAPASNLLAVQNALAVLPNAAAVNSALAQLAPAPQNLAAPWVAWQATNQFEDILLGRVEEIQELCCDDCGPNRTQVNTRKCTAPQNRGNWWAKAYLRDGTQRDVNGVFGYKTEAKGVVLAYDTPLNDRTRAGVGVHYSNGTIDGNNSSGRMNVDSYQAMAYFSHAPAPWFVQGTLVAGKDDYDGSRNIVFPGVNQTATASYSGAQYTGLVRTGFVAYNQKFTVTPFASLQYSHVDVNGHTEQGAADISLRVERQKYNFLQSGLGVKAEKIIRSDHGTYAPEAHFKWLHDFKATTMQQTAAFTGGGGQFSTLGVTQDRNMFNVGAGVTFLTCDCDKKTWTVKGLYDYNWNRSDYSSHQLSVIASLKW